MTLQFGRDATRLDNVLDDAGIMLEAAVLADEHAKLVVVGADVGIEHVSGNAAFVVDIIEEEVEHHVAVVERRLVDAINGKAVVVVPWLHDGNQLVGRMLELVMATIIVEHFAYLILGETHHGVELGM